MSSVKQSMNNIGQLCFIFRFFLDKYSLHLMGVVSRLKKGQLQLPLRHIPFKYKADLENLSEKWHNHEEAKQATLPGIQLNSGQG